MKLGVIAALAAELRPTLQALKPIESATIVSTGYGRRLDVHYAPPFWFTAGGIGEAQASSCTAFLIESNTPDGLLSVGFCGALTDDLSPGDILLGGTTGYEPSTELLEKARKLGPYRVGTVTMVDHVVVNAAEKREIVQRTGAAVVDMESAAVAKAAKARGLPFLCVKVVIDTPSQPLASTYASFGRVTVDILKKPWIIARMIGDGRRAKLAAERLRDFFVAFAKEINPSGA